MVKAAPYIDYNKKTENNWIGHMMSNATYTAIPVCLQAHRRTHHRAHETPGTKWKNKINPSKSSEYTADYF